jgi:UDP-N-acetylmuramoyl-tripeptide--D-alanyl-D-alanine ligase
VLAQYKGNRYLVLGDMGELGETSIKHHRDAGELAKQLGIDKIFALGELSINALQGFGSDSFYFESHDELNESL